jgi:hypothetical protein
MTTVLSSRPDLAQIKRQAKELLKAQKAGDPSICDRLRKVQRFVDMSDDEILAADIKLAEAQHALAKEYGFNAWAELKQRVLKAGESNLLHIQCGDSSAGSLRQSSVPGEVLVWHDPVSEGPVPGGIGDQEYREIRAKFFVDQQYTKTYDGALQGLTARHENLARAKDYAEVVLWFDACLFDQTIMVHVMEKLARIDTGKARLSLICVGEHPNFERFLGLGQLSPEQMAALFPARHEITQPEKDLAVKAWKVFSSDTPRAIEALLAQDCSALPYLADALRRHLEECPSVANGLSRLQREALEVVASGTSKLGEIFTEVSNKEERPFFGDTMLWDCLDEMAGGKEPLLKIDGPGSLKRPLWEPLQKIGRWNVDITSAGKDVLAGKLDYIKLNGIDRWLGGVHLQGAEARWRWNEKSRRLVETQAAQTIATRPEGTSSELAKVTIRRMNRNDLRALRRFDDERTRVLDDDNAQYPPGGHSSMAGGPWSNDQELTEHFEKYRRHGGATLLALDAPGRIVGFADLWPANEPEPFGRSLNVECIDYFREYYLAGLETMLLAEAEKVARALELPALDIGTNTCSGEFVSLRRFGLRVFYEYDHLTCECRQPGGHRPTTRVVTPESANLSGLIRVNHWSPTDFSFRGEEESTHLAEITCPEGRAVVELWHYRPGAANAPVPGNPPNRSELFVEPGVLASPRLMTDVLVECAALARELGAERIQLPCPSDLRPDANRLNIIERSFAFAWLRKALQ